MEILVTAEEMRALDRGTIEGLGIPSVVLMERAALALVEEIKKRKPGKCRAVIFAGTGNNGGDGLAAARMLTQLGDTVRVVVTGNRNHATEEWRTQLAILEQMKIPVTPVLPDAHSLREENPDILIDAMLGTGLSRPLNDRISTLCDAINSTPAFTAAMDVPSGNSFGYRTGSRQCRAGRPHRDSAEEENRPGTAPRRRLCRRNCDAWNWHIYG